MTKFINSDFMHDLGLIAKTLLLALTVIVSMTAFAMWSQWLLQSIFSPQIVAAYWFASFMATIAAAGIVEDTDPETVYKISLRSLTSTLILSTLLIFIFFNH